MTENRKQTVAGNDREQGNGGFRCLVDQRWEIDGNGRKVPTAPNKNESCEGFCPRENRFHVWREEWYKFKLFLSSFHVTQLSKSSVGKSYPAHDGQEINSLG
ncbi:hypothetical protein Adt_18492 [Abeliophyllum distichum]|uniref:Uncharacterized protein n=1 Tax=Abeliophyllum distichum TaxID=126358 RepID=A0ABD1TJI0_9LAMI